MSGLNSGIVLVRLFAIYLAINAIQSLLFSVMSMFTTMGKISDWGWSAAAWMSTISLLLPAACALLIWRYAEAIVPKQIETDESSVSAATLMYVGISLLGLYFFVWGLIYLVRVEMNLATSEGFDGSAKWAQRVPYIAQMLVATPMLLGRERIASLLLKVKFAGTGRD